MRTVFIIVTYKEPKKYLVNLTNEIKKLKLTDYKIYHIDNLIKNKGYAAGVNVGIKKGLKDKANLFVALNPDITLGKITKEDIVQAGNYFDVWGYAMKQDEKIYYGGEIDKWRMSGGLIIEKPSNRFTSVDYVTGSFIVTKREVIEKIGQRDEQFFVYYEDVDYCFRAKKAGFRVGIDAQKQYEHFELSKTNKKKDTELRDSRMKFFLKFSDLQQKVRELMRLPKTILEGLK